MKKITRFFNKLIILLIYRNDTQLLTYPGKKDRDYFIKQAIFGTITGALTGGVFLTGLYIEVGAPEAIMGYIPLLGSIAGISVIFTGVIVEKVRSKKKLIVTLNIIVKTLICSVVWVPLFVRSELAPFVMLGFTFTGYTLNSMMGLAINSLFIDTVSENIRGRYMGVKQIFALIISATFPVIAGRFVDLASSKYVAFCILFSVAYLAMFFETNTFIKISEKVKPKDPNKKKIKIIDIFRIPIKNKKFMKMLLPFAFFYLMWFFSMSFASLYLIRYMELPYTYITALGTGNAILQMILYPLWGKFMDKYGIKLITTIALTMYTCHAFIYMFMVKDNAFVILLLLNINSAIMAPAWALGIFNSKYSHIPDEGRSLYDGFYTSVIGLTIFLAPTIGTLFKKLIVNNNMFESFEFAQFRIPFAITFVMLACLLTYKYIESKKDTNWEAERKLVNEIKVKLRRKR